MYQNCAVVDILSRGEGEEGTSTTSFGSRPVMFVANIGGGCGTVEAKSLRFPDPGVDVDVRDAGAVGPTGESCQAAVVGGDGSGGGMSSGTGQGGSSGDGGGNGSGSTNGGGGAGGEVPWGQHTSSTLPSPATGTWTPGNTWPSGFPSSAEQGSYILHYRVSIVVHGLVLGVILYWIY